MAVMDSIDLGMSADGYAVYLDYEHTNVAYHLLETPQLLEFVQEALPHLTLGSADQAVIEYDMGRVVGTTNLVETSGADEIVYAKRIGREKYSRFVKGRELVPCQFIVVVVRRRGDQRYLWTAMCGRLLPADAYDTHSVFAATHAMVYDESLIQMDTLVKSKPAI